MQNVKGTCDYFGKEQRLRNQVRSILEEMFQLYDFDAMETAVLNELVLLASKYAGGDEIIKEMYQLTDQGKRAIGLRYDLTIPFAKVIAMNPGIELPYKRYEIGKVFRDGPVKRGRLREFLQCDADIVGVEGPEAEAELMQLATEVFRKLDIPVILKWNNRRFLGELLEAVGVPSQEKLSVMLTLDKLEKIGMNGVRDELIFKGIGERTLDALLKLIGMEDPDFDKLIAGYGIGEGTGALEVFALQHFIRRIGLENICVFDPFLSRGLSFYTGTVYEIFDASRSYASSLGGGGRYDAIIGQLVGRQDIRYPTVGLSFGMESIMEMLRGRPVETSLPAAIAVAIGDAAVPDVMKAAAVLRANGIRTGTETSGRKLKKTLAAAASKGIRYVLLIGENEAAVGKIRMKDMKMKTELIVTIQEVVERLKRE